MLGPRPFCGNPTCALHVVPGEDGVEGEGNWADVDGQFVFGSTAVDKIMYCDFCARTLIAGAKPPGVPAHRDVLVTAPEASVERDSAAASG